MNLLRWTAYLVVVLAVFLLFDADVFLYLAPHPPSNAFNDQVVWITGASSGLGAELAIQLTALGAQVVMSARRMQKLNEVAEKCIGKHEPILIPLDVTDYNATTSAYEKVKSSLNHIDIVVLNAGRSQRMSAVDMPFEETVSLLEINLLSAIYLTKLVLPDMLERHSGKIVAISSLSGKIGTPGGSSYSSSKFAMHGYFDALRSEIGDTGVKVSLVLPGPVESDIVSAAVRHADRPPPDEGKKMTTPRFANVMIRGMYHDFNEMWISTQPFLLFTYMAQYAPWLSRKIGCLVGPARVKAIREDGNPFDMKKLLGF